MSQTFDLLDAGRTPNTISKKVASFLSSHPEINKFDFQIEMAKMAENKFNQLVVPYLKMSVVNILDSGFQDTIKSDRNLDGLQFFSS